jgi:serine/threonine protein kinase
MPPPHDDGVPTVTTPTPAEMSTAKSRYTIVRHVASGGMGDVYEATDATLNRRVALKMLGAATPEGAERFRREIAAAAALQHPYIVPVHDAGVLDGRPFFTMAFVDGESLAARVRARGPLPPEEAVRLLLPVVDAIAYAHNRHIVHRDLKPENVLLDASDSPWVTDFGLARNMLDPGNLTATSQLLGTPRYMAPEQVRPGPDPVGPAADVYALGGVLVFLLTGEAPVRGDSLTEVLLNVLHEPPLLPADRRADVPAALNEVCRRCLAKSPADRYPSAADLRAALTAAIWGPPPAPLSGDRRRTILLALAAVLFVIAVVLGVAWVQRPDAPAPPADEPAPPPPAAAPEPTPPPAPQPEPPTPAAPRTNPNLHTLTGHKGRVWVSFAPDSRSLVSWGDDATLRVWDATTGKAVKQLTRDRASTMAARWSPDGTTLAVALSDGHARAFTLPDWDEKLVYRDGAQGVTAVAFAPDGGRLAVGTDGGGLVLFDAKTWARTAECVGHSDRVLADALFFSVDGKRLVSASRDDSVRVWDAASGKSLHTVADRRAIRVVLPTPSADRVVLLEEELAKHHVRVLDVRANRVVKELGERWVAGHALTPDGKVLWTVGDGGTAAHDLSALRVAGESDAARGECLALVPGGVRLLIGRDGLHGTRLVSYAVKGFELERLRTAQEHRTDVTSVAVSPDGRLAATGDEAGVIRVWDLPTLTRP